MPKHLLALTFRPLRAGNDEAENTNTEGTTQAPQAPVVTQMPEQNGVREPRPGTNCAAIWELATRMSTERKATVAVGDLIDAGTAAGFNVATIKTQYARWRKFHGIEGRVESEKARLKREEAAAKKAEREAEKEAKRKAREEEKARKAAEKEAKKAEKEAEKKRKAEEAAAKKAEAAAKKAAEQAEKEQGGESEEATE
ncbi:hypothetical protein pVco14_048 [Vibrio phage pVco-14]|nr:hypothetical protein pVco14_048 [Vibrio phage pVco-14]